jgi:hypothetical protein
MVAKGPAKMEGPEGFHVPAERYVDGDVMESPVEELVQAVAPLDEFQPALVLPDPHALDDGGDRDRAALLHEGKDGPINCGVAFQIEAPVGKASIDSRGQALGREEQIPDHEVLDNGVMW